MSASPPPPPPPADSAELHAMRARIAALEQTIAELQAAQALHEHERRLAEATQGWLIQILEATPDLVGYISVQHELKYLNRAWRQLHGLPDDVDLASLDTDSWQPEWVHELALKVGIPTALRDGIWQGEVVIFDSAGRSVPARQTILPLRDRDGNIAHIATVLHDLRAERVAAQVRISLERRLRDAQRLESLGVLAGGIAHDFNNILTAIMGNVELAILEPDLEPATRAGLEQAFKGAQRAAELTRQLLAFAGRGQFLMHPLDLNTLVLELCDSMQRTPSIAVELDLAPDLPAVEADEAQLRQLIASLLANAVEALEPQHRAGQLLVRTRAVSLSRPELQALGLPESLAPHLFVQLRVEDNGHGMDRATLARIFDPFFSTRFLGRGLGLAAARGIVRAHQGALQVLSEPGLGTNVLVWLPVAPQPTPQTRPGRTGSVLVVGAESATWEGFVQQLTPLGFTPIFLDTTTEALARISAGLPDLAAALLAEELPPVERTHLADAMGALHPGAILISLGGIVGTQDAQIAAVVQALLRLEP